LGREIMTLILNQTPLGLRTRQGATANEGVKRRG
jgi:hypothetical protein